MTSTTDTPGDAAAADPFAAVAALPGVADAVARARESVDRLLDHRILRRRSADVSAESALRGSRASAALEGADWPLEEIRRRTRFADEPGGALVQGALRASAETGTLQGAWHTAPLQALARLHVVAAADVVEKAWLGRPRSEARPTTGAVAAGRDTVDSASADLSSGSVPEAEKGWGGGEPPAPAEVGARLAALAELLTRPTKAPAMVVAAVVHGELLAVRPFVWGNGLVARAAQRLVLVERGLDPKALTAPEVGHLELGVDAYHRALDGYMEATPDGVASWVRHCAQAVGLGAREMLAVCEALLRG